MMKNEFHIILIRPSKYDDDGYVIRWLWGITTSSSLACLHALTVHALGDPYWKTQAKPVIHVLDESYQKIPVRKLVRKIKASGGKAVAALVGVQTNQYARALDLAGRFRSQGVPSMIGGFHVSGCLQMLPEMPPEIQRAVDQGITVVAGEVEDHWGGLLREAYENRLKPVYNFIAQRPSLEGVPPPSMPESVMRNPLYRYASVDAGRGCPFHCSFCTIINIQGNVMRGRTADDIEKLVRAQHPFGVDHVFITDDNFSRNPNWESILDRLIELKEKHGIRLSLIIQGDTAAHKIPGFIEKAAHAGVRRVFIGMESVNPENLKAVGKHHNQIKEYRRMLQKWRKHGVLTYAGYILGFPGDTYESIMRDVETLKRELPLDQAEFFIMTPLPGSKDHQALYRDRVPMAEDTNLYDSAHVTTAHPRMTQEELERAYRDAWKSFYSDEHVKTLLLRRKGPRRKILRASLLWFCSAVWLEEMHPLMSGFFRLKDRTERRPGMPVEPLLSFRLRRAQETLIYAFRLIRLMLKLRSLSKEASLPENLEYSDETITPV